jgi:hypothetical protein
MIIYLKFAPYGHWCQKGEKCCSQRQNSKGEKHKGGEITKERDQLKFEHTSRGSKLLSMIVAFSCAHHMFVAL